MDLETARAAKEDIQAIFARRGSRGRGFALGVAPAGGGYAIALRASSPDDLNEYELAVVRQRATGELDVHYTGAIAPLGSDRLVNVRSERGRLLERRLGIGSSVAHRDGSAGTLGFFARRNSDGILGLVSNNHVLALADGGQEGDPILHPSPADGGEAPRDLIARLCGDFPRLERRAPRVDCAFARLLPGIEYHSEEAWSRSPVLPEKAGAVAKIGRTTAATKGRITAFELNQVGVMYSSNRVIFFDGQIEIRSDDGSPFGAGGDSGSLVFTLPDYHPVGLLFALSATGTIYANPIDAVLSELDVSFA
jgi:hypothetical protein